MLTSWLGWRERERASSAGAGLGKRLHWLLESGQRGMRFCKWACCFTVYTICIHFPGPPEQSTVDQGASTAEMCFLQFWRLEFCDQGASGAGFFCVLARWLADAPFLLGPRVVFFLSMCIPGISLCVQMSSGPGTGLMGAGPTLTVSFSPNHPFQRPSFQV